MHQSFALFDFDGTLIRGDSIILFMRYLWRRKLCTVFDIARFTVAGGLFTLRLTSPKRAKEMALRFLRGRSRAEYVQYASDFCETVLKPRLFPQGIEAIRAHQAAGEPVLLITASPTFYLEPLKSMLGLHAVLGTQFATDGKGRFTGHIAGINCRGDEKPIRIREYLEKTGTELDSQNSSAYGNSTHDLPMLRMCGHAYAVNPSRALRKRLQKAAGIQILHWKETR
ncbi:MAG TPA: HAD family hydrolase [Candidatus Limiplasma sp.]|nr:HAD family hydrolase [Candidatus Limiplasma sp.]HRX07556.1 HAD family hydrolase [Candidatus Limiplasma sp.]